MKILVVDDQDNMCWILDRILSQAGFEVITAPLGRVALELMRTQPANAAIIDYRLPDMDGLVLLSELKTSNPSLTGILITSYGTAALREAALRNGFHAYFDKPFRNQELLASLVEAIGKPT